MNNNFLDSKITGLIMLFLIVNISVVAQSKSDSSWIYKSINGKVYDKVGQMPIAYATVSILKADSSLVRSVLSAKDGSYEFANISTAPFRIKISFVGFSTYYSELIQATKQENLLIPLIDLSPGPNHLNEVTINSASPILEQKIDRFVFNVENATTVIGGDAIDALKITPGVGIRDDQIGLIGKSNVIVMIDDRKVQLSGENLVNFLATIKTSDIKSIEVITNPPARYDAEGNSGIINIRLKKAKLNSWSATLQGAYTQDTYANGNGGANLTYNKDKLSFVFNADYKNGSRNRTESDQIFYPDQYWNTGFDKRIYTQSTSIRTGFDYQISNKWAIGIQYLGSFAKASVDENDNGSITSNGKASPDSLIKTLASSNPRINSNSFNFHTDVKLDTTGELLTINVDHFNFDNTVNRSFDTQTLFPDNTLTPNGDLSTDDKGKQSVSNYSFKADVDVPSKLADFSFGGRLSFTDTKNDLDYFNTSSNNSALIFDQTDLFTYKENTQALYASVNKSLSKKLQFQLGLRMENTDTRGSSISTDVVTNINYLQFFPTFYTSYKLDSKNTFSFNYGRRVGRPGFADLNPFKLYSSTYSYSTGNPFLQPQYSNTIEAKYNFSSTLFTTLSYLNENHGFGSVPFVDDDTKVQYFMDLNYYTYDAFNVTEDYVFNVISWWQSIDEVNVFYTKSTFFSAVNLNGTSGWGSHYSTNNSFNLNKDKTLSAGFNYRYQSSYYDLIYKLGARSSFDLALKYAAVKKHLQFALVAQDIFRKDVSSKTTYNNDIKQIYQHYDDSRLIRLSVSYKFGNSQLKAKTRSFGNEEEKGRTN